MLIKKIYCDYESYQNGPFTHSLSEMEFNTWATKATYLIDNLTYGRASVHAEALSGELSYACGQIAEILKQSHSAKMAAVSGLAGASNDGYSETYVAASEASKETKRICYGILEEALGCDVYGLLYAGVI
jgi:hypothetical protein